MNIKDIVLRRTEIDKLKNSEGFKIAKFIDVNNDTPLKVGGSKLFKRSFATIEKAKKYLALKMWNNTINEEYCYIMIIKAKDIFPILNRNNLSIDKMNLSYEKLEKNGGISGDLSEDEFNEIIYNSTDENGNSI